MVGCLGLKEDCQSQSVFGRLLFQKEAYGKNDELSIARTLDFRLPNFNDIEYGWFPITKYTVPKKQLRSQCCPHAMVGLRDVRLLCLLLFFPLSLYLLLLHDETLYFVLVLSRLSISPPLRRCVMML